MRLLDTPQWESLTTAEKRIINNICGNGDELTTSFTPGAVKVVNGLAARGLITVTWGERHRGATEGTLRMRDEGWL